jgi:hypothetical protein
MSPRCVSFTLSIGLRNCTESLSFGLTQQLARFVLLQYRSDLLSLRSKSAAHDASRSAITGSHSLNDGWTPSGGVALGGLGKHHETERADARDHMATDKETLFYDLLTILHRCATSI